MSIRSANLLRSVALALLTVALAGASACGGKDGDSDEDRSTPRPTTTTTDPPTTSTTLDEDAQTIEAAKAGWADFSQAIDRATVDPVDPHLPELQAAMTGDFQFEITANLEGMQARGEAARISENTQRSQDFLRAEALPDGSVQLTVCEVNDEVVYEVATGEIVNDRVATATVDVTATRW